jgi:hypothetical protein
MKQPIFYWHLHHNVLVEALTEPLKNRIDYIKKHKPKDEISLRLKRIKRVKGKLPIQFVEAYKAWHEADKALDEAYKAWDEADTAWDETDTAYVEADKALDEADKACVEAYKVCLPQLFKLHKKECGCKFKVSIFDN